jgi:hypothetical protein
MSERFAVHLTEGELKTLIASAVAQAMDAQAATPEYRDRASEAQRLGISVAKLDRLVREGLPTVWIGSSPRFRAADVDAHLAAQSRPQEAAE